ncbi:MAG: DUF370 domain-containing protein [Firmicutes bacterium]|nr:DUF370 domain-containing protein [Bacillota bacterium]
MRMFSIGPGVLCERDDIVGIFDLDTTTVSKHTREFLRRAQEAGAVVTVGDDLPQTFVAAGENVYLSPQSSANLAKKLELPHFQTSQISKCKQRKEERVCQGKIAENAGGK